MSTAAPEEPRSYTIAKTDDPVGRARLRKIAELALEASPEVRQAVLAEGIEKGQLLASHAALRRVMEARGIIPDTDEDEFIDACTDLDKLGRWQAEAALAPAPETISKSRWLDVKEDGRRSYRIAEKIDDEEVRSRQRMVLGWFLEALPEERANLKEEGALHQARAALRRVLGARGLMLDADHVAMVDACTDLDTLGRWLEQSIVALGAAEALR
jgi:hypothetical protein